MNHLSRAKQLLNQGRPMDEEQADEALVCAQVALADAAERIAHQLELIAKNAVEA